MKLIKDILITEEFAKIENQLTELYKRKDDLITSLNISYPNETELKVVGLNEDGSWSRLSITDNLEAIKEGFWKSVKVERYSTKLETLKNKPKELVEAEGK